MNCPYLVGSQTLCVNDFYYLCNGSRKAKKRNTGLANKHWTIYFYLSWSAPNIWNKEMLWNFIIEITGPLHKEKRLQNTRYQIEIQAQDSSKNGLYLNHLALLLLRRVVLIKFVLLTKHCIYSKQKILDTLLQSSLLLYIFLIGSLVLSNVQHYFVAVLETGKTL